MASYLKLVSGRQHVLRECPETGCENPGTMASYLKLVSGRQHVLRECPETGCENPGRCNWCDGGLAVCTVCKGAEGDLPTECPGVPMTEEQHKAVYGGTLDFKNDQWIRP